MRNLHNYNIGHRPFKHIKGGMIGEEEYHTAEEYHSAEEEPEDERIQHFDEVMSNFTTERFDEKPNDYKQIELQYAIDFYNGLKEYQKPFQEMLERIRFDDQPPLTYDEEGFIETEPQVQWALKHYQEPLRFEDDSSDEEDEKREPEKFREMLDKKIKDPRFKDMSIEQKTEIYTGIMGIIINKNKLLESEALKKKEEEEVLQEKIKKEIKRAKVSLNVLKNKDPKEHLDYVIKTARDFQTATKNITSQNITDKKTISDIKRGLRTKSDDDLKKSYEIIADIKDTTKLSNSDQRKYTLYLSQIIEVLFPKYTKVHNEFIQADNDVQEFKKILMGVVEDLKKLRSDVAEHEKKEIKLSKKEKEQRLAEQRTKTKLEHDVKLEKEIEERKKKEAEQAKQAAEVEPVEPTISKAKAKKSKAAKKSEEDKEFETIKNYAQDRIERINPDYTGNGKVLETFFTELGEPIIQYITRDRSKIHDNELNDRIPDEMVMYDNGEYGSLRKAVTIDLYNDNNAIEIKNYKQYDKNKNDIEEPNIPLQLSKYEGTKYFIPLYLENGKLYNIQLIRYDEKTNAEISRSFILPNNPEGRNLFTVYRLADGLYKFDPSEHKSIKVKYNPIEDLKTPEGKQLYAFDSMNLGHCKDHNGRESFNVKKYLTKIKI
jgi:hypothetical protein